MLRIKYIQGIYSGEIRRKIRTQSSTEKKKQVKSAVGYRVAGRELAPERKNQVKSAVRYREVGRGGIGRRLVGIFRGYYNQLASGDDK